MSQTNLGAIHNDELSSGFNALAEALRVNKNANQLLNLTSLEHLGFRKHRPSSVSRIKSKKEVSIETLVKVLSPISYSSGHSLASTNRRLYEVQL